MHFHILDDRSRHQSVDIIFPLTFVREWVTNYKSCHIFSETFAKISIYFLKMGVWNDLDEKHLWHEIKRGPFKLPPNSFQIGNLEGDIWTFEQIDELWQSPSFTSILTWIGLRKHLKRAANANTQSEIDHSSVWLENGVEWLLSSMR
jgi:hypothetical protein